MSKYDKVIVAVISVLIMFIIFYVATSWAECDGTLVRGLFGFECIPEQNK